MNKVFCVKHVKKKGGGGANSKCQSLIFNLKHVKMNIFNLKHDIAEVSTIQKFSMIKLYCK